MEMLAERYHWTFEDIKKIPKSEMKALLKIITIKEKRAEIDSGGKIGKKIGKK